MKFIIYTDVHWSSYSSILRRRGEKYSVRLENLIKSVSWAEEIARQMEADAVICLGDFFDSAQLNSEEVTALNDIRWSDLPHYFIVGNHEMGRNDLSLSTSHLFGIHDNFHVIDKPTTMAINDFNEFVFLPYMLDSTNYDYTKDFTPGKHQIVLSHNDIKGIQMGKFISQTGFDLEGIHKNCRLFINGHLHNGEQIGNMINLGNLTGQNFSEDAFKYNHNIMVLDTDEQQFYLIENPYAFNFYKINSKEFLASSCTLKANAVVSCTCSPSQVEVMKSILTDDAVEFRISVEYDKVEVKEEQKFERVDGIEQFQNYVLSNIGVSDIIKEELTEVCN